MKIDGMNLDGTNANILLNREATMSITKNLLASCYPDTLFEFMDSHIQKGLKEIAELNKSTWKNNIDFIFRYSESPIERIFLSMFNLYCIEARFSPLIFTSPLKSINEETSYARDTFIHSVKAWKEFSSLTGNDDIEIFLNSVIASNIEQSLKDLLIHNLTIGTTLYTYFHVSIQSTIRDFKINGKYVRPDIFIWIPARPNFKLIVECDGFQYHSKRQAFTADRARDRTLQDKGFQILRFSGDEISHTCSEKVEELRDYLLSREAELFQNDDEIANPLEYI
jgi:hypothetical protein